MKETVRALETGAMAEIAILAFFIAFIAVCAYAFMLSKKQRQELKNMPLDDAAPAPEALNPASGDGATTSSDDLLLTL